MRRKNRVLAPMAAEPVWCVVPAAGRGTRFGTALPKQYATIAGEPLLLWTLKRVLASTRVAGIMLVLARDDAHWRKLEELEGKPILTAIGASERAGSVLAGLRALPASVGAHSFVLVHDAARPCVAVADIDCLIEQAGAAGGGLLAAPLRDTLKLADQTDRVVATEPREARWRALTPQLFRRAELEHALAQAESDRIAVTDEAMAMERAGHRPLLVEGDESNIKVTTASDLTLAEYLLLRDS